MRRVALAALVFAFPSAAQAADLTVAPRDFSPAAKRLRVHAELPAPARAGIQLATEAGRRVGWIVPPQRRRFLTMRWDGRLGGADVPEGRYVIGLVDRGRVVASSPLRIDRTAPRVTNFNVRNGSRTPFRGDNRRLTTISPNGDRLRDAAKIRFRLSERALVHFEVTRTVSAPQTVYELKANLRPGRNVFTWHPPKTTGPRTYLVRITTTDSAGNRRTYGADNPRAGRRLTSAVVRVLGVDAGFTRESYGPNSSARLVIETDATSLTLQTFRAGPEESRTHNDTVMVGAPVSNEVTIPWQARHRAATLNWAIGRLGVRHVLRQDDGERRPDRLRAVRRSPRDARRRRAGSPSSSPRTRGRRTTSATPTATAGETRGTPRGLRARPALGRAFIRAACRRSGASTTSTSCAGVYQTGKTPEMITESDLEAIPTAEELIRLYDFVIFGGHTEYVTRHEFDLIEGYRNLGGNLAFLSANNFFWEVRLQGRVLRRTRLWRDIGRPEATLLGVQYRANDDGRLQRPFIVRSATTAPWLWAGTGLVDGATFGEELGGYGIEIDQATPLTPVGTILLADIPDLFGPGLTAQMTYYETPAGAKVFAAGAIDFGGSAMVPRISRMLENLWARLAQP